MDIKEPKKNKGNRIVYKKKSPDFLMVFSILILLIFGLLMVFSSSALGGGSLRNGSDLFYYFFKQLRAAGLGLVFFFIFLNINLQLLKKLTPFLTISTIAFLILVLFMGKGATDVGSSRWLFLGPVGFQPSELAKVTICFVLASYLSRCDIKKFYPGFFFSTALIGIFAVLVLIEPDLGTTVVVGGTGFVLLFVAGANILYMAVLAAGGLSMGIFSIMHSAYQRVRWEIFQNPMSDPLGFGYQTIQALYAIGSGGLTGVGLGKSMQIYWIPEKHTDFIFSILSEELGFLGAATVVVLFIILMWRGFEIAYRAPSKYMRYLAVGLTSMISIQAFINLGVVTHLLPVTGITLPFISYGGTSLLVTMASCGVILNISKYRKERVKNEK